MGLDYAELRRFRKRISDGGSSNRVTEALLEMDWRENLSVDEALKAYSESQFGSDMEAAEEVCDELVHSVRELIEMERQESQDMAQMLRAAASFFDELERVFCNKKCQRCLYNEAPCPIKRFHEYLIWVRAEFQACE